MNNTELVEKLKILVNEERRITAEILSYLNDVEDRKIFAKMGYPSLFEFCVKELGYSEGAAQRRISAMRLIRELPQVEEKIVSGALSLSVVSQAQTFFKKKKTLNKPLAMSEKLELLSSLENSSARACEKTLLQLEPEMAKKDKERYIDHETLEIKITVDREFVENLEMLKNQLSHQMPTATTKDILAFALKSVVAKSMLKKEAAASKHQADAVQSKMKESVPRPKKEKIPPPTSAEEGHHPEVEGKKMSSVNPKSRYISFHVKRIVWQKANGKCQYYDLRTGRRCESQRFLEIDHIVPKACAGSNQIENLQLLCDAHNRLKGSQLAP